ncbi:MAG: succinylglutamate desuccinylase/aspartoacylase family protein [Lachnospiraceae bacterium]|nr:succinylglutamate desuccinylase/aspartoacylase family protein [Lachnospiraceae bacterium]
MKESIIYQISHIYRDDYRIRAFTFGQGEKSLCIVGSIRGNEYQQIFLCSRMIRRLKKLEEEGRFAEGHEVMVIPSLNPASMNIGKRFWGIDNTDINRMFPGYPLGETTQRIAAGVFEVINKYNNGIQFTSFYMPGDFQPYVQMIRTGYEDPERAKDFGMPYIVVRDPRPYDTTTLNYNWQIWETDAYSLYSGTTTHLCPESADMAADAIERFMICRGILKGTPAPAAPGRIFHYDDLLNVRTTRAGLYQNLAKDSAKVSAGQVLAEITDPCTGEILETLKSSADGIIFFQYNDPLIYAFTSAFKILADE